jgi:hypothetical protein
MKEAKSIYKGGEIVYASECDYESAKKLGIVCPFCNEPLFWRDEFARLAPKTKDIVIVDSHFAHYANVDGSICEKRSLTPEGRQFIEEINSTNRGQRLLLFERYFLRMVSESWSSLSRIDKRLTLSETTIHRIPLSPKKIKDIVNGAMFIWNNHPPEDIRDFLTKYIDNDIFGGETEKLYEKSGQKLPELFEEVTKVNARLHKAICLEALDFLLNKRSRKLVEQLSVWGLYLEIESHNEFEKLSMDDKKGLISMEVIIMIAWTRWQQMFEKFKNEKPKGFGSKV